MKKKKESVENIRIPVNRYVKQGREREMGESITVGTARRGERCMTTLERWPSCYICRMWRSRSSTVAGRGWRRRRRIRWPTWRSKLWVIWLHHQLYNTRTRSIICILGSWGEKKKQFGPRKERLGIIGMDVIGKNQSQIWFRFHFFLYASIPTTPTSSCFLCPCLYILIYANHASCICCGVYIYMHGPTNLLASIYKRVHPTTICSFLTLANPTLI